MGIKCKNNEGEKIISEIKKKKEKKILQSILQSFVNHNTQVCWTKQILCNR